MKQEVITSETFQSIAANIPKLRIVVIGDICLDRYLEIDPDKEETSIETGLPVFNVVTVRSQPGGAGTIVNNLAALGVGKVLPVSFAGEDGEGFELRRALETEPGISLDHFFQTPLRRTFTYTKPLRLAAGKAPVELNRLDFKNWTPTPAVVRGKVIEAVQEVAEGADAIIMLAQVDVPETGVITSDVLGAVDAVARRWPEKLIIADSRRGLRSFPNLAFKMNRTELASLLECSEDLSLTDVRRRAAELAARTGRPVFVTLAEQGIVGAAPGQGAEHVPALPVRGEIDIVGAGDAVTANLAVALAAGADMREAMVMAMVAGSIVIHELGATGTASVRQIRELLSQFQ
jgi:rfaE bifunctional protein kinase chain/domain